MKETTAFFQVWSCWNSDAHLSTRCLLKIPKNQHASVLWSIVKIQKLCFSFSLPLLPTNTTLKLLRLFQETAYSHLHPLETDWNSHQIWVSLWLKLSTYFTQGLYRGINIQIFPGALIFLSSSMLFIKQETHNEFIQTEENHRISVLGGTRHSISSVYS